MTKTREEVARFIEEQMRIDSNCSSYSRGYDPKVGAFHYGYYELRRLMDYLYDGPPKNKQEELVNK